MAPRPLTSPGDPIIVGTGDPHRTLAIPIVIPTEVQALGSRARIIPSSRNPGRRCRIAMTAGWPAAPFDHHPNAGDTGNDQALVRALFRASWQTVSCAFFGGIVSPCRCPSAQVSMISSLN